MNKKVTLVLGGGGARGMAHIGVLEILQNNNIPINRIVGTSAGSIVGAFYAAGMDIEEIKSRILPLKRKDMMDFSFLNILNFFIDTKAPVKGELLKSFIENNIEIKNIEDLPIPFVAVAADINTGQPYCFDTGPLGTAVAASSAFPPIFSPVKVGHAHLVDGGTLHPVPVSIARLYDEEAIVLAVNINNVIYNRTVKNMFSVAIKSMYMIYYALSVEQASTADLVIHPPLEGFNLFSDRNNYKLYELGKQHTEILLPQIKALIE